MIMRKIYPEFYQGKEILKLCRLPIDQAIQFKKWLDPSDIITVVDDNGEHASGVHYTTYEFWFDQYQAENRAPEMALF